MDILKLKFIQTIKDFSCVEKIILYGSRARKDNSERSDIDIAVVCPKATEKEWLDIYFLVEEQVNTLLKVDCVRYDDLSETNPLKKSIDKDGIIIFEKGIE